MFCGMLGPDRVGSSRRLRSLGIAGAVRRFNERAVPGLGGIWFGKPAKRADERPGSAKER